MIVGCRGQSRHSVGRTHADWLLLLEVIVVALITLLLLLQMLGMMGQTLLEHGSLWGDLRMKGQVRLVLRRTLNETLLSLQLVMLMVLLLL